MQIDLVCLCNLKTQPCMFTQRRVLFFPYCLITLFFCCIRNRWNSVFNHGNTLYTSTQSLKAGVSACEERNLWAYTHLKALHKQYRCISVPICPLLVATCHEAAAASSLTGLTGSHRCLPPHKARRQGVMHYCTWRIAAEGFWDTSSSQTAASTQEITRF